MEIITVSEAKQYLKDNYQKGTVCPCCGQHVQLYRYSMFATSARALIALYKLDQNSGRIYFHVRDFAEQGSENRRAPHFTELRFWGLVEPMANTDTDKKASGYWRITDKGRDFVEGNVYVRSHILIYNGKFRGFDGDEINIQDALNKKFSYAELMNR